MAEGFDQVPGWTRPNDAEVLAMCDRLLMEPPTNALCVDAAMLLQRLRPLPSEDGGKR